MRNEWGFGWAIAGRHGQLASVADILADRTLDDGIRVTSGRHGSSPRYGQALITKLNNMAGLNTPTLNFIDEPGHAVPEMEGVGMLILKILPASQFSQGMNPSYEKAISIAASLASFRSASDTTSEFQYGFNRRARLLGIWGEIMDD